MLIVALALSATAAFYSIIGLMTIFAAAAVPVAIMGSMLEVAKLTVTVWLHEYWSQTRVLMRAYLSAAVVILMLITSIGCFGFLSKAHSDLSLVSGDVQSKIAIYDEKIKVSRENIDANRKALKQLDDAVDQVMGRSTDEKGADKAVALRRSQGKERARLIADIETEQKKISQLNEERAPIAAEVRKVEAEVGPIKYIAALIYGDNPDANLLERAVRWVIIMLVLVFDPLAVMMLLAATESWRWSQTAMRGRLDVLARERPPSATERVQDWKNKINKWRASHANLDADGVVAQNLGSEPPRTEPDVQPLAPEPATDPTPEPTPVASAPLLDATPVPSQPEPPPVAEPVPDPTPVPTEPPPATFPMEVDPVPLDTDDFDDEDDEDPVLKRARALWKDRNPGSTLKEQRRRFNMGEIDQLPWVALLEEAGRAMSTFGPKWPLSPVRGDQHIRTDLRPTQVYKYNGTTWIPVDKSLSDGYSYNDSYINFLIDRIAQGEYDPELLNDTERLQIEARLKKDRE